MKQQIVEKLIMFLNDRPHIKEEFEVIYLMVELRKIIDIERDDKGYEQYQLVRFHADWMLHTRKDRITPAIIKIMKSIEISLNPYPNNGNIEFIRLPEFRKELTELLETNGLPNTFCNNEDDWTEFIVVLAEVLSDQPIIDPTDNIAKYYYVGIKKKGVMVNIDYKGVRKGESASIGFGF